MAFTDTAPLDTTPTVPLQTAQQLLETALQPPADAGVYEDGQDQAAFQANLPNFFRQTFDQLQQYNDVRQQQQEAYQAQTDAQQEAAYSETAAPPSPVVPSTPGAPTMTSSAPTTPGSVDPSSPEYAAWYSHQMPAATPDTGFFGGLMEKLGSAVEPYVKPVVEGAGEVFNALPQPVQDTISTGAHGYQTVVDNTLMPVMEKLAEFSNLVTQNTLDPVVNALLPQKFADPITDLIDTAGVMAPYIVATVLSGGTTLPVDAAMIGAFAATGASDATKYLEAYKQEELTTGQFLSGMAFATLQVAALKSVRGLRGERPGTALELRAPEEMAPPVSGPETAARSTIRDNINQMNDSAVQWQTSRKGRQVTVIHPETGDLVRFERDVVSNEWKPVEGIERATGEKFAVDAQGNRVRTPAPEEPKTVEVFDRDGNPIEVPQTGAPGEAAPPRAESEVSTVSPEYKSLLDRLQSERGAVGPAPMPEARAPKEARSAAEFERLGANATGAPVGDVTRTREHHANAAIDDMMKTLAEARSITDPAERARFFRNAGLTKTMEELAIDRGQMQPGETREPLKFPTKINQEPQTPQAAQMGRQRITTPAGDRLDYRETPTGAHISDVTVQNEGQGTGTALFNHVKEQTRARVGDQGTITGDLNSEAAVAYRAKQPGTKFFDGTGKEVTKDQALDFVRQRQQVSAETPVTALPEPFSMGEGLLSRLNSERGALESAGRREAEKAGMTPIEPGAKATTSDLAARLWTGNEQERSFVEQALRTRADGGDTQAVDILKRFDEATAKTGLTNPKSAAEQLRDYERQQITPRIKPDMTAVEAGMLEIPPEKKPEIPKSVRAEIVKQAPPEEFWTEVGVKAPTKDLPLFEVGRTEPVMAKALAADMHSMIRSSSMKDLERMETSPLLSEHERILASEEKLSRMTQERLAAPERLEAGPSRESLKTTVQSRNALHTLARADSVGKLNGWMRAHGYDPADYTGPKSPYWVKKVSGEKILDTDAIRTDLKKAVAPDATPYDRPLGEATGLDDGPTLGRCARL